MQLKKFFNNLNKNFSYLEFDGFEYDSKKIKKNYIFLQFKGVTLMAIIL